MPASTLFRRKLAIVLLVVAVLGIAGGWYVLSDSVEPGVVTELDAQSFAALKDEFNGAAGHIRLIVLLSPS